MFEGSDDYDFTPSESTNLASIFGTAMTFPEEGNQSLRYVAPKQPKPPQNKGTATKVKQQSSVIRAKVVTLYKLIDNDYQALGKHGLAIIGSTDQNIFEMILYKEKNNIITRANINSNFILTHQTDNFSSFHDHSNQSWLILFLSTNDRDDISKEIEKHGGKIVNNNEIIEKKTDNPKTETDKIEKVASQKIEKEITEETQTIQVKKEIDSDSTDGNIKANILSRMAKMGQSVLPGKSLPKSSVSDLSDSETTDVTEIVKPQRKPRKYTPIPKERDLSNSKLSTLSSESKNALIQLPSSSESLQTSMVLSQQFIGDSLSNYVLDNKLQNAEIKLSLSDISLKLDHLLRINSPNDIVNNDSVLKAKIKALELKTENLLSDLQKANEKYSSILKDFNQLKVDSLSKERDVLKDLSEAKSTIESQRQLIQNLEMEMLAKCDDRVCDKCEQLNKEMQEMIEARKREVTTLQDKLDATSRNNRELNKTIEEQNIIINDLKLKIEELEGIVTKSKENKQKVEEYINIKKAFTDELKGTMSSVYESILSRLDDNSQSNESDLKGNIAGDIKKGTYKIIKDFNALNFENKSENS